MTARRFYALLAAAAAAFVVYGSLVPFHFRPRPLATDAVPAFRWAMASRAWPESRSDGLANLALGVPLGFALLGACRSGRPGVWPTVLIAVPLLAGCTGLAAAVEFAQLFVSERTCAGSDVIAQTLGAATGMAGWLAFGERATRAGRDAAHHPRVGGRAGRVLAAYLLLVLWVQLHPLDLSASPYGAAHKLRSEAATLVPFAGPPTAGSIAAWLGLAALFLPAGLLASRVPNWPGWLVAVAGAAFALSTEAGQLLVSRHPSTTDGLAGGAGVAAGWLVGRWWAAGRRPSAGWDVPVRPRRLRPRGVR